METKEILKQLRKEKGYSAKQVAEGCEMSLGVYQKYESGERGVGTPALCKFADFYDVTTDYLLGREDNLLDFLSLSDDDKNLEEKIGAMLLKFYRSVPAGIRKDFLSDARKLFEVCKEEFYEQPRESTMVAVETVGDFRKRKEAEAEADAQRKETA